MTQDMIELGKLVASLKGFKWMPGMLDDEGDRVLSAKEGEAGRWYVEFFDKHGACSASEIRTGDTEQIPDLSDAATLGCLLALVRVAWCSPVNTQQMIPGQRPQWRVWMPGDPIAYGKTEAAALVAALEAAP